MRLRGRLHLGALALAAATAGGALLAPAPAVAAPAGVSALIKQAQFWEAKGRTDLALSALRRALAVDPENAQARALLAQYSRPKAPPPRQRVGPNNSELVTRQTDGGTQAQAAGQEPAGERLGDRAAQQQDPGLLIQNAGRREAAPTTTATGVAEPAARTATAATTGGTAVPRTSTRAAARAPRGKPYVRSAADQAGEYRLQGFRAIEQGQFAVAEQRFASALKVNASDSDAIGGMGIVRLRTGNFTAARELLGRAVRLGGQAKWGTAYQSATFYGQLRVAQAALAANRLAEAERATQALAPADSRQDALARSLLADVLQRQGRYAEALQMYRSIPGSQGQQGAQAVVDTQTRQARLAAMQAVGRGDYPAAERVFQQALVAGATDPWLRYEYARLLVAQGRVAQADGVIGPLTRVRSGEPLYAAALYSQQVGRPGEANRLIALIPSNQRTPQMQAFVAEMNANTAVAQARALQAQGRNGEALALLRRMAATPLPIAAAGSVADGLYTLGDTGTAVALAQSAAAQPVSAEPDAYQGTVVVLAKAGADAVAVPLVERIAQATGQNPYNSRSMARLNALLAASRADRLRQQGGYAQAFDILQQAYATAPGDVDVLAALARLYQAGQLYGPAFQTYQLVRQQRPNDVGNLIGYTDAAIGADQLDAAREAADTALRLAPGEPEAYLVAARVETARGREGSAIRYLQQARTLRGQQGVIYGPQVASTNPFARTVQAAPIQTVNPFLLARPGSVAVPQAGYGPQPGLAPRNTGAPIGIPFSFNRVPARPGQPTALEG